MGERALLVDRDILAMIEAFTRLRPEEREQILYFAQHPEELRNIASFEEIRIDGPAKQAP